MITVARCCIGIRAGTYDDLVTKAGKEFCWFCNPYHDEVMNLVGTQKIMQLLLNLMQQVSVLEEKLDNKLKTNRMMTTTVTLLFAKSLVSDDYVEASTDD